MRSISVELRFEIHKHRTTRSEFLIGNGLLKFCISFVDLGVKCGGVKFLARHGKLVNEREVKTAEAFDGRVASALGERRGAATRDEDGGSTQENISEDKKMRSISLHECKRLASDPLLVCCTASRQSEWEVAYWNRLCPNRPTNNALRICAARVKTTFFCDNSRQAPHCRCIEVALRARDSRARPQRRS